MEPERPLISTVSRFLPNGVFSFVASVGDLAHACALLTHQEHLLSPEAMIRNMRGQIELPWLNS